MSSLTAFNLDASPRPTRTQADKLPPYKELIIPNIKRLSTAKDIYLWGNCIEISLCARHLNCLISDTLPRPTTDHPGYQNWLNWSRLISKWLVRNVDPKFTPHFQNIQAQLQYADTTYKEILGLKIPKTDQEDRMTKALIQLWNTRRHKYPGIDEYVDAWRNQVVVCQGLTVGFDYLSATKIMLHEMEGDSPVLAKFIRFQLENPSQPSDARLPMTYEEFDRLVRGIIGAVKKDNLRPS
ncbi:Amino acid/polyamine transporter I [Penicillium brevicompactum]|uniref:Amino acid/polyamine transporter I n=1 Tax=Penicillium brevicompactum TaxID=5074 RepID=UPI002541FA6C|nr:Amino acid/polyamine transporter I [Penicillium brevicompactum]KAJ5348073.1 Amino acid/polyamine transporter I [Penicillium brevicompactum]